MQLHEAAAGRLAEAGFHFTADRYLKEGAAITQALVDRLRGVFADSFAPRTRMRVDQCTDKYRYILPDASANWGKMRVSTYEIARGVMMAVTEEGITMITVVGPTQLLKTTFLESTALYYMLVDPKPVIFVEPNEKAAKELSKVKINGMIDATPRASAVMYDNVIEKKSYRGGFLKITNAGSKTNLAMTACAVSACDETDKMELLDGAHPVLITEKRTSTFAPLHKNLRVCSPEFEDGFIWQSYLKGDQRQPFVVCPHCGHDHVMRWATDRGTPNERRWVIWDTSEKTGDILVDTARYRCPSCETDWTQGQRLQALAKIRWRQTKKFKCCDIDQDPQIDQVWIDNIDPSDGQYVVGYAACKCCGERAVRLNHASFWTSRLYSPKPLSAMVTEWRDAQGSISALKSFVNDELAEPWKDVRAIELDAAGLRARQETYPQEVPDRCALLTGFADVQGNRLEAIIVGWGRGYEAWIVDYAVLEGDPTKPDVWHQLDEFFGRDRLGAHGLIFDVSCAGVDSSYLPEEVYRYVMPRLGMRRYATKGASESGSTRAPIVAKSPSPQGGMRVPLEIVGTTLAKNFIASMLAVPHAGPRFVHFPEGLSDAWYSGFAGEKQVMKQGVLRWVKRQQGTRNEPWDTFSGAFWALEKLKAELNQSAFVEIVADQLQIPHELTLAEQLRFGKSGEATRIAEETRKSMEQGRAKPVVPRPEPIKSKAARVVPETPKVATPETAAAPSAAPVRRVPGGGSPPSRQIPWARRPGS